MSGALVPSIVFGYARTMCGNIIDGISLAIGEGQCGFVMNFSDLEAVYLEAKNFRERHPMTDKEKELARILNPSPRCTPSAPPREKEE